VAVESVHHELVLDRVRAAVCRGADHRRQRRPAAVSPRSGRVYQPGIGPHPEDRAVDLIVAELTFLRPDWRIALRQWYPGSKQTCDLLWGNPPEWAIEIKMFRPNGDNG
jgi:hypothetical protein